MSPLLLLFVARDAILSWKFDGTTKAGKGRYELVGKPLRGEVAWFVVPKGRFDAEALYKSDTARTKEADATKAFSHVRASTVLAGMAAIQSDQRYLWNDAPVVSRCVYCAQGNRAWIVRLWWPRAFAEGETTAEALLKSFRLLK